VGREELAKEPENNTYHPFEYLAPPEQIPSGKSSEIWLTSLDVAGQLIHDAFAPRRRLQLARDVLADAPEELDHGGVDGREGSRASDFQRADGGAFGVACQP
jgi:hypothetical protein